MKKGRLPNAITLARILLSPVFILFFYLGGDWFIAAFLVGLLFEATDFLDGAVARSQNQITGFGKILDPLADSISRFTVFLCLLWRGFADILPVAIIFYRDALVATVRTFSAYENVLVAARWSGKIKAGFQSVGITIVLIIIVLNRHNIPLTPHVERLDPQLSYVFASRWIVWIVAVATGLSGVDYIKSAWPLIRRFEERQE